MPKPKTSIPLAFAVLLIEYVKKSQVRNHHDLTRYSSDLLDRTEIQVCYFAGGILSNIALAWEPHMSVTPNKSQIVRKMVRILATQEARATEK